jgi:UDP-N-acetylmuramate--alanine ligase
MCPLAEVLRGMGLACPGFRYERERLRQASARIGHLTWPSATAPKIWATAILWSAPPPSTTTTRRSPAPWPGASRSMSGPRPGAPSCANTPTPCASPALTAKPPPPPCAPTSSWPPEKDPTVMIGGTLPLLHSGYRVGKGDTIILESCEYCNSFLSFYPTVAVILNVEADHLDFFKDLEDIEHSFRKFAELVPPAGARHRQCRRFRRHGRPAGLWVARSSPSGWSTPADCTAANITEAGRLPRLRRDDPRQGVRPREAARPRPAQHAQCPGRRLRRLCAGSARLRRGGGPGVLLRGQPAL